MRAITWAWIAIAMLVLGLTTTNNIYADSTGATSPTVAVTTPASISQFINEGNAFASDDVRATAPLIFSDQAYGAFGFDISVPDGSTINGITVSVEARKTGSILGQQCGSLIGDPQFSVKLSDPTLVGAPIGFGSFAGDTKTTGDFLQNVDSIQILGGTSDTWNNAYTDVDNFWILITSECGTIIPRLQLDHVTVDVDYTLPASGGGQNDLEWKSKPTFGISPTSTTLVIKCGFGMDNNCFDMTDEWHTPFEKIVINTGETHDFELNIQAQMRLKNAGFCLVPAIGSMEGELCIGVSLDGNGAITGTEVNQDEQLVDESQITFGVGRDGVNYKILINNVEFIDQPFYEVIGLYATDYQPRIVNTFLNEGIDVVGESFVEQPVTQIASNLKATAGSTGLITLTRVDKFENIWSTDEGILYTFNDFGSAVKLTPVQVERIADVTQNVMTRTNNNFQLIKDWTTNEAEQKMREMYPNMFREVEFSEINDIVSHNVEYVNHKQILASKLFN